MKISESKHSKIKCIIVNTEEGIQVYYKDFEKVLKDMDKYKQKEIFAVCYPNFKQKQDIMKFMLFDERKCDLDYVVHLIYELTNLRFKLDIKNDKDRKILNLILNHTQQPVLVKIVQREINDIIEKLTTNTLHDAMRFKNIVNR